MKYLFRISTKRKALFCQITPKPVYYVARNKQAAAEWAEKYLKSGLEVKSISKLAEQVGNVVFVGGA